MRKGVKKFFTVLSIVFVVILAVGCDMLASSDRNYSVYNCNELTTSIEISKDGEKWGEVKGDIFSEEDPLALYDADGNMICKISDSYNLINEYSYGLYLNDEFKYDMLVIFDLYGEIYKLYNGDELVATITFYDSETKGALYNKTENVTAIYEPYYTYDEFSVRIKDNCNIEDEIIIMVFSSYYNNYDLDI